MVVALIFSLLGPVQIGTPISPSSTLVSVDNRLKQIAQEAERRPVSEDSADAISALTEIARHYVEKTRSILRARAERERRGESWSGILALGGVFLVATALAFIVARFSLTDPLASIMAGHRHASALSGALMVGLLVATLWTSVDLLFRFLSATWLVVLGASLLKAEWLCSGRVPSPNVPS
jgi:hypothetical protein